MNPVTAIGAALVVGWVAMPAGLPTAAAANAREAGPSGALDTIGDVWEWTSPSRSTGRVVRGGSWRSVPPRTRASFRGWFAPDLRLEGVGLRCAQ
jgi:formylglycine-generating enzyme required for sulfatase activity